MKTAAVPEIPEWTLVAGFDDILYSKSAEGIAKITINRPEVRNAFRPETVKELQKAFEDAREDEASRRHRPDRAGQGGVLLRR